MALFSKDPATPPQPQSRPSAPAVPGGTYFGPNIVIEGTVSGSEPILIEGTVRGKVNVTGELRIGTKARVEATVHARTMLIEGKVTGDISADDRVELVSSASVDGNIKAPKIIVAEGAKFRGNVDMGSKVPREDAATRTK